ncbi:YheC/YheD family protein [Bacillus salitolerans]|uniref:YheC/YheD family protein n=1 Tax=Bacillus salitolerans TaxID=1437434 RepID=A0ABW4LK43_9BACI
MQPYVGMIVPNNIYKQIPNMPPDVTCMFSLFEEAAQRNNVRLCYFTLSNISPYKKTVKGFVKINNHYTIKELPRPSVIYSRVLDHLPKFREQIQSLVQQGVIIFNRPNYDVEKYTVHQLLEKHRTIRNHLPETLPLTFKNLRKMMNKFNSLILKTNYGERGIGAMKLDKIGDKWCLLYKNIGELDVKQVYFTNELPSVLLNRMKKRKYIIQETISLATCKGSPFDMRVSVQKDKIGIFVVTGITCKVAKQNDYLTNGSQGSTTHRLEDIFSNTNIRPSIYQVKERIESFSLAIANYMNDVYPHLADLGFDIGVTKEGTPYFIECNFISDYLGGLIVDGKLLSKEWDIIFKTPIDYAKYLLETKG